MDPVGPWSAYASYNRLAGASGSSGELHHHLSTSAATGAPPTTTAQLLPGSFLTPPPVGYETVFSPLFHHAAAAGTKPSAHYVSQVSQHRAQALVQAQAVTVTKQGEGEFHQQAQVFFEQGAAAPWQQNSPFGILPHESVVATATSKTVSYENFNPAHFAAAQSLNHLNSQLSKTTRAQSPQVAATPAKASQNSTFFQVPVTFTSVENAASNSKTFTSSNSSNMQQSCIVSSPATTKEYRVPPNRTFLPSPNTRIEKQFPAQPKQTSPGQIQTKTQSKVYPELGAQVERARGVEEGQTQSSPISFSILDGPGRLNYAGSNSSGKRTQFATHNYRHYPQGQTGQAAQANSEDFQRPKSGSEYTTNGTECNVAVPRRPSPLQAHSQASPIGHAQSPAYPMYNSPMNSLSSPQQNTNNQVSSPLDVSVPRPNSQTGSVAYPSVITRALNTEKSFPERYERTTQPNTQTSNQNCWDDRQRKFANQPGNYNTGSGSEIPARQIEVVRTERQQTFFDASAGHQVVLQDLSSCRGDPMSLVKNLQQQQSCQLAQSVDGEQEIKQPLKRRKSNEKVVAVVPVTDGHLAASRVPPPAHTSGNAGNQQQLQNGTYLELDRWNLPPATCKIISSQPIHQQQGLMVPHPHGHHAPPTIPYFAPFHIPPHPTEFTGTVELTPLSSYGDQNASQNNQYAPQEEQPKVVVPNIEEELNFLSEVGNTVQKPTNHQNQKPFNTINSAPLVRPMDKTTGPGAGFMSSYLKFLQGERDSSPPPLSRGNRKQTWSRPAVKQETGHSETTNGVAPQPQPPPVHHPPPPMPITRLSQGDPQDDPRYFPLPKERKRNSFSSDDGLSSDDDFFCNRKSKSDNRKERSGRKGRPCKPGGPTERKRQRQQEKLRQEREKRDFEYKVENVPRRELSKRAAKEKAGRLKSGDEDMDEPPEFQDSDSDPAWTPAAKNDDEDGLLPLKKTKRGKRGQMKNLIAAAAQGAGINELDGYSSDGTNKKRKAKQNSPPTLEDNIAASLHNNVPVSSDENPFKPGEFVVIKSELSQDWPALWRVDGKTLLQKYEPFEQNGITLYRNISTYTSWTPESKKQYVSVPVRYHSQGQLETVIEFLKKEMTIIDQEYQEQCMKQFELYQDNFEVYIQTLISQSLDSNFLMEIFQEKDEYFLSNVRKIDEITDGKKGKLLGMLRWPHSVQTAVCTWPCFNIRDINASDAQSKSCAACMKVGVTGRVLMYGQPYNSTTLEGCQPDPNTIYEKDFLMCRICANRVELLNKVTHQKYLMYIECAKRVAEKRTTDPTKDTTCILNELLADENWLNQLFLEVRTLWSEIDGIEHSLRSKNNSVLVQ